jgi:hypothetical protein
MTGTSIDIPQSVRPTNYSERLLEAISSYWRRTWPATDEP